MPPSLGHPRHQPGQNFSVLESARDKWDRLSPWWSAREWQTTSWNNDSFGYGRWDSRWHTDRRWTTRNHGWYSSPPDSTSPTTTNTLATRTTRSDVPVVRNLRRGTITEALAALKDLGVDALVESLVHDRYAITSTASQASLLRTWERFHREAFKTSSTMPPMLPITPAALVVIVALFKGGGYRSYPNYSSAAKGAHIQAGHVWTQLLHHTAAWVSRSVLRGIGPPRQSCSFVFERLRKLPRNFSPLVTNGPHDPIRFALLATSCLLREIEASTATTSAWTFDDDAQELTWLLPGSKSDHRALGVSRTWPCTCGHPVLACVFHLAREHRDWLDGSGYPVDPDSPLFPNDEGIASPKAAIVLSFEAIGAACGQPLVSAAGLRLFGGHTPRVTGAQLYAALGLEINKIRLPARHSGETIMRYVAEAPLRSLRTDLGLAPSGSIIAAPGASTSRATTALAKRINGLEALVATLEARVREHKAEFQQPAPPALRGAPPQRWITNMATLTVHRTRINDDARTICGWPCLCKHEDVDSLDGILAQLFVSDASQQRGRCSL